MKKAFVIDFDGTITVKDVGFTIVQELSGEKWKEFNELRAQRKIGTPECSRGQWSLVNHNEEDLKNYLKKFSLNKGFKEFLKFANKNSYKLIIASDGYDVYINEILKELTKEELENIHILCNKAVYNKGWKLSFPYENSKCNLCGNCKKKIVKDLKDKGYEMFYVGDGESDKCACVYADKIFAKSFLKEHCEEKNIEYKSFNDFFDILKCI
ncbi:MtnX-like HAD-IB family phosphatase [Clostridium sp. P21]|uniref:MtnX-like HAD-IB family phosphatase n=1 Tax=Clostridium muellerianum TaxID=2716538 RepID=A0A7Y0EKU8_9CLOT|nr:MtnX-like HAD-IB family phosphatase [Clostridium muellerianum]NMM65344.1 MtnX-like HAD-IB family phosphatase [Clostridium muellerianum]